MYSTFDIIVSRSEREHMIQSQLFFQSRLEQPVHDGAAGSSSPSLCKKWDWLFTSSLLNLNKITLNVIYIQFMTLPT